MCKIGAELYIELFTSLNEQHNTHQSIFVRRKLDIYTFVSLIYDTTASSSICALKAVGNKISQGLLGKTWTFPLKGKNPPRC